MMMRRSRTTGSRLRIVLLVSAYGGATGVNGPREAEIEAIIAFVRKPQ